MLSILRRTQEHRPNAVELLDDSRNGQNMGRQLARHDRGTISEFA